MPEYTITHVRPGSTDLGDILENTVIGTYQNAVDKAHEIWNSLQKKTQVSVYSKNNLTYFWHSITTEGKVIERNCNSNVTFTPNYQVEFSQEKGYHCPQ